MAFFNTNTAGTLVCYTATKWGGALRDDTKNGCVADYRNAGCSVYNVPFITVELSFSFVYQATVTNSRHAHIPSPPLIHELIASCQANNLSLQPGTCFSTLLSNSFTRMC